MVSLHKPRSSLGADLNTNQPVQGLTAVSGRDLVFTLTYDRMGDSAVIVIILVRFFASVDVRARTLTPRFVKCEWTLTREWD